MKKVALPLVLAAVATAPAAAFAKTKKPAQPLQKDPQQMTFDEAMEVNKRNLSLIPKGLPLVLPSWTLPVYFAVNNDGEAAKKPATKHAKKTKR